MLGFIHPLAVFLQIEKKYKEKQKIVSPVYGRSTFSFSSMRLTLLFLAVLSYHLSIGQHRGQTDSIADRAIWKHVKTKAYSVDYPPNWTLDQSSSDGTEFTLFPPKARGNGGFTANLNFVIQDISGRDLNLDKYAILSERQVHTLVENSKLIAAERIDSMRPAFHQIVYTGDHDKKRLKWKMRFWVLKDKAYILTYTATKEDFGLHIERVDEIMDTCKL